MYAIFIFDTVPSVGEPISNRSIHFYCRTFGFTPTIADAAEKLTLWIGRESMYTKRISVDDFTHVKPGIYIRYIDWAHKVIMLANPMEIADVGFEPEELFELTVGI